ncbi:uncharacterized protein YecT (DUF1311 family) [Novosphingobium sp. PhB57]|jgi:uncharacterized protein YecT (DUF1311 family)|uniref:lysozyme inhibitor LprI family protein n=1 Tax=Novosphingobium sp. PhB57 TaxID=2485107 RepID=UPI00104E722C|nr:lysozyme inhibitor LprI family protein [Novosphingobium sp. PhB57]TCU54607.1 uncharacterized protein YecT (DUF1311 family) [Novosphingobium sp. PhB57]
MMKVWAIAIVAAGTIAAMPVLAQSDAEVSAAYTPLFDRCMKSGDAAQGVTAGVMDCLGRENIRQDARLNHTYKVVMGGLNAPRKATLRGLQRSWLEERESTCHAAMDELGGGTASAIVYSNCFLDETIKRTLYLKNYRP